MQPDPEPGTGDQQQDPSADDVQQDPLPEIGNQCGRIRSQAREISSGIRQLMVCSRILCRIRNAGSGDQDNRYREQLRRDPLPEISNQCGRIRSQARVINSNQ